jgi:hypothetical protein
MLGSHGRGHDGPGKDAAIEMRIAGYTASVLRVMQESPAL